LYLCSFHFGDCGLLSVLPFLAVAHGFTGFQAVIHLLKGITVAGIPALLQNLFPFAPKIRDLQGTLLTREQRGERAFQLVWMAFALLHMLNPALSTYGKVNSA
jgi:hypothetical protein